MTVCSGVSAQRPQEPKPPFPYATEEVEFENTIDTLTLAGTFSKPQGNGKFPAVILVTGSGPQNRNEEIMGHKPFLVLADQLTRNGIAVLRYDDRGVGNSTGTYSGASISDFARDAKTAFEYLLLRPDVDAKRIGLIGHSEGGQIGQIVAAEQPGLAFLVALAGPGVNGVDVMIAQTEAVNRSMGLPEKMVTHNVGIQRSLMELIAEETNDDMLRVKLLQRLQGVYAALDSNTKKMVKAETFVNSGVQKVMSKEFLSIIRHDPQHFYPKIKCPVLALNGTRDIQVIYDINLKGWENGLKQAGNNNITTRSFEGLNHLFQHCKACTVPEYGQLTETISPETLDVITAWVQQQSGITK
ncbi:alpha/beta hydrolase family protein [Chitinophaga cymbidii]|uniref:Serine aminopeptidase S33 domain-containing protein n=1 Tax=Chitinophaga cymbidii TaxID=1096750 RepID=A0A512RM54_9BACT|nr:alpha/beta hydrolase [Chitinophaga cymbidii]GEP96752.1 hypothetical protein CCY01nite_30120 [Chitinophaga cymbidii]